MEDDAGQHWVPVRLPDGREGLWACSVDGGAVVLDPEGPWWHVGEAAQLTIEAEGGAEREDGQTFDYVVDPVGLEEGFIPIPSWEDLALPLRVAMLNVTATATEP